MRWACVRCWGSSLEDTEDKRQGLLCVQVTVLCQVERGFMRAVGLKVRSRNSDVEEKPVSD